MNPWIYGLAASVLGILSLMTSAHAILYKRDPRAAVSWVGFVMLIPLFGPALYLVFGINRVQRRAGRLKRRRRAVEHAESPHLSTEALLCEALGPAAAHLKMLSKVGEHLTRRSLLQGNRVRMLVNGEEAFPAMLQAIDGAKRSVGLLSYIMDKDALVGEPFIAALKRAQARGCQVRVLIDDVGSPDEVQDALQAEGIQVANFLPLHVPGFGRNRYANLRNHRKILVVDGAVGFTGGMNLRGSHLVRTPQPHPEEDTHFRIEGPVVSHLVDAFIEDWSFTTREQLGGEAWYPPLDACGPTAARGVPVDPAESHERLKYMIVAALGQAVSSVKIVTPYFLPDAALVTALNVAALRGVAVDILIPERLDHKVVQWAMQAMLWQVLVGGCRVWRTPPPFDHSKLLVVDEAWTLFGSANLDPRSLRLNFEFNVEAYDRELGACVSRHIESKRARACPVTLKDVDARSLAVRLRDGLARLWTPYL